MKKKFKFLCVILSLAMVLCTSTFAGGGEETLYGVTFTYNTGGGGNSGWGSQSSSIVGYHTINSTMFFVYEDDLGNVLYTSRDTQSLEDVDGFGCIVQLSAAVGYRAFSGDSTHSAYVTQVGYWGNNSSYEAPVWVSIANTVSSFIDNNY